MKLLDLLQQVELQGKIKVVRVDDLTGRRIEFKNIHDADDWYIQYMYSEEDTLYIEVTIDF